MRGCRCGAAEGCLFPDILRDADGNIGVPFRTCDLKARPVTVSGTTPLPPETARTGDMAAWTSGAPPSLSHPPRGAPHAADTPCSATMLTAASIGCLGAATIHSIIPPNVNA